MLIARVKKETNIIEYVLYMYQIEDIIRSFQFDLEKIDRAIVQEYDQSVKVKTEIKAWYADLIEKMQAENIQKTGHLEELSEIVNGLNVLHRSLLTTFQDKEYQQLYEQAANVLNDLKQKSDPTLKANEIAVCINGLYGLLVLRLKKQPIAEGTKIAMEHISKLMAKLAHQYNQMKMGKLQFPETLNN
jgi:hypothetical protein